MKPVITIDPRLLQLLGNKLYSSHPLPIVVRELLQNSRDACIRANVVPDIRISIKVAPNGSEAFVECSDNGIGMTDEQLINDFLCLGNTSKSLDSSAVGGFGIAKAALMRNPEWSVRSLGNYIDNVSLREGLDIKSVTFVQGTTVNVHITEKTYGSTVLTTLAMIYFSDVCVDLDLVDGCAQDHYHDEQAGWPEDVPIVGLESGKEWHAYRFDELTIKQMDDKNYAGFDVVRLNGLVQFIDRNYYGDRRFNLLFEITPTVRPDDKAYPLTMSREELTGQIRNEIRNLQDRCNANPITMEAHCEDARPTRVVHGAKLVCGRRNADTRETIRSLPILEGIDSISGGPVPGKRMLLVDYDESKRDNVSDSKILALWHEIIQECTCSNDIYGIGLIVEPDIVAGRVVYEGETYYLLNPDALLSAQSTLGKIHLMHTIACHEAAHFIYFNHGEAHSVEEMQIHRDTVDRIVENLPLYKKILR